MANENGKKKDGQDSSAEDILGQLAQEMGVDDEEVADDAADETDEGTSEEDAAVADESPPEAADETVAPDEPEAPAAPAAPKSGSKGGRKSSSKSASEPPAEAPASPEAADEADNDDEHVSDWVDLSDEEAINTLFSGSGEERPVRPVEIDESEMISTNGGKLGWILFAVCLIGGAGLLGGYYMSLDEDRKRCLQLNLEQGRDACDEYFKAIEEERIAEANRQRLANAPKYGSLTITTDPRALRISAAGQETLVFPGTRTDLMVPVRSQISFENISVTEPFTFTIHGEGVLEDREITIPSFDAPDSPWIQNQISGDYSASLTYSICWPGSAEAGAAHCLAPTEGAARELRWRLAWRPPADAGPEVPSRLLGSITVTSDPSGAAILFNGQQLYDEETGQPYVTPHTFSTYNAPRDREDRTPLEVYLSRDGLRITVGMEGKVQTADGVYAHHFRCDPVDGATPPPVDAEDPDFLGYCNYSYSVHLPLRDPPPPTAEGSGAEGSEAEGSGAGAAPADGGE